MTKLLDEAIAKVRKLPEKDQDELAIALLSMAGADAAAMPFDDATRAAIREGLAQAERGEFVSDELVAEVIFKEMAAAMPATPIEKPDKES
jgi:predicted transcriptional regulator